MAVRIRMKKMGSKKRPFYRIVVADSRSPRDGRFIDMLGYYNPLTDPAEIKIDEDKLYKWLDDGAVPTDNTRDILKQLHLIEKWQLLSSGVAISEVDAKIEELRAKQPKPKEEKKEKLSKKAVAAAKKAEEDKTKAEEEAKAKAEEEAKAAEEEKAAAKDKPAPEASEAGPAADAPEAAAEPEKEE